MNVSKLTYEQKIERLMQNISAAMNIDMEDFLSSVRRVKDDLGIVVGAKSNDTARRRITVTIIDEYLMCGGNATLAFFYEANLYKALKQTTLYCTGLCPEEERLMSVSANRFGCDTSSALKLVSEGYDCTHTYPIVNKIMEVLNGTGDNEIQVKKIDRGKRTNRSPRNNKVCTAKSLAKRTASHRTWKRDESLPRRERTKMDDLKRGRRRSVRVSETKQD